MSDNQIPITSATSPSGGVVHSSSKDIPGAETNVSFTAGPNEAAIAAGEKAATEKPVELPDGITPEMMKTLTEAGFTVQAPGAAPDVSEPLTDSPDGDTGVPQGESLEDLQQDTQEPTVTVLESMQEFSQEWQANDGKLSDESREKLKERHNVDDEALDFFMASIQTARTTGATQILNEMGVQVEDFQTWEQWSAENETAEVRDERWEMMKSANSQIREVGVQKLKEAYAAANGGEAELVRGGPSEAQGETFKEIMARAMKNPLFQKYGTEGDAYRAKIDQQLAAAQAAGRMG